MDFRFERCAIGNYSRIDKQYGAGAGAGYRKSKSLGQICKHLVNNNNVELRRAKSSTGICERPGKMRDLLKRSVGVGGGMGARKNMTTQKISVNNDVKRSKMNAKMEQWYTIEETMAVIAVANGSTNDGFAGDDNASHASATPILNDEKCSNRAGLKCGYKRNEKLLTEASNDFPLPSSATQKRNRAAENDRTIIENLTRNLNVQKKNTNPFLELDSNEIECAAIDSQAGKNGGRNAMGNGRDNDDRKLRQQRLAAASNDVEEPISVMCNNDDTISIDEDSTCKSNWINNSDGCRSELFNNKSCASLHSSTNDLGLGGQERRMSTSSRMGTLTASTKQRNNSRMRRHKETAANKDWSHIRSTGNLLSGDDYQRQTERSASNDKRHNYHYHQQRSTRTAVANDPTGSRTRQPKTNLANDEHTKNTMPDNYLNEFGGQDSRNESTKTLTSAWPTATLPYRSSSSSSSSKNINPMADIPTCPFQRQDYTKPDDEFQTDYNFIDNKVNKKSKRDKKDIFGFALSKVKLSGSSSGNDTGTSSNLLMETPVAIAPSIVSSSHHHQQQKGHVPYLRKLNISYPNKTQLGGGCGTMPKDDRKYFDRTKKSLIRIGQKCGLRLSRPLEKGALGGGPPLQPPSSHRLLTIDSKGDANGLLVQRVQYKSYRSELDLTKNLHYLDAFLNENFDRLSKSQESHSIGKVSRRKDAVKSYGHKRAKSYTKNLEKDLDDVMHDISSGGGGGSAGSGGTALSSRVSAAHTETSCPSQDGYYTSGGGGKTELSSNILTHKSMPIKYRLGGEPTGNVATMHYPHGVSSSDSFSTYNSKLSNRKDNVAHHNRDVSSSGGDKSAKSNTTSSSLSSSDYASVYSPSSSGQMLDYNNRFSNINANANALLDAPMADPTAIIPITNHPSHTKRGRMKSLTKYDRYSRNSYCTEPDDDQSSTVYTTNNGPPLAHSLHDDNDHMRLLENSLYQYENKLPYHENYLQHYYNNLSDRHVMVVESTPDLSQMERNNISEYHQPANRSATHQYNYMQEKSMHNKQGFSQQRIVLTSKSKPFNNDVVLEYEC